jgi:hypothetical protein
MIQLFCQLLNLSLAVGCESKSLDLSIIDRFHYSVKNDIFTLALFENAFDEE